MFDFKRCEFITRNIVRLKRMVSQLVRTFILLRKYAIVKFLLYRENYRIYPVRLLSEKSLMLMDIDYITENKPQADYFRIFLKEASSKKAAVDKNIYDIQKIYMPAILMYCLMKLDIVKNASLFGGAFSGGSGIDEFAIIIISIVGLYMIPQLAISHKLGSIIYYYASKNGGDDFMHLNRMLYTTFDAVNPFFPKMIPFLSTTKITTWARYSFVFLYYVPILSLMSIVYFGRYFIAYNMYQNGAFGYVATLIFFLFIYVELMSIFSVLLALAPLPFRDYSWLNELDLLESIDSSKIKARRKEVYQRMRIYERLLKRVKRESKLSSSSGSTPLHLQLVCS